MPRKIRIRKYLQGDSVMFIKTSAFMIHEKRGGKVLLSDYGANYFSKQFKLFKIGPVFCKVVLLEKKIDLNSDWKRFYKCK